MAHAQVLVPQPRGYGSRQLPKMASLAIMFRQAPLRPQVVRRAWEAPRETKNHIKESNVLASLLGVHKPPRATEAEITALTAKKAKRSKTADAQAEAQSESENAGSIPRPVARPAAAPRPDPATREVAPCW